MILHSVGFLSSEIKSQIEKESIEDAEAVQSCAWQKSLIRKYVVAGALSCCSQPLTGFIREHRMQLLCSLVSCYWLYGLFRRISSHNRSNTNIISSLLLSKINWLEHLPNLWAIHSPIYGQRTQVSWFMTRIITLLFLCFVLFVIGEFGVFQFTYLSFLIISINPRLTCQYTSSYSIYLYQFHQGFGKVEHKFFGKCFFAIEFTTTPVPLWLLYVVLFPNDLTLY